MEGDLSIHLETFLYRLLVTSTVQNALGQSIREHEDF